MEPRDSGSRSALRTFVSKNLLRFFIIERSSFLHPVDSPVWIPCSTIQAMSVVDYHLPNGPQIARFRHSLLQIEGSKIALLGSPGSKSAPKSSRKIQKRIEVLGSDCPFGLFHPAQTRGAVSLV